ncbi:NAD(P)/FAD-dependent oxidoreductase [Arenicella xantha]|uniref:3-phenylpropionate/trans-cinnamate dioxygenase ferredoxin reductase subunit n=1 Tax=Arenicella xantha TaxID=644221 RepID=A0A395JKC8_9GAMM|nr:FAD-dependent oxidoreductase [Arenicella xantha]RBP47157.1 3-phenylpropionate/trans-cinnamate dioxygenase ferredoxin reductase subunit [Arenicella xantha]
MKNVVIIGASHAAAEAISSLRKHGWTDAITLIGDETQLPYQRPPLSKGYFKSEHGIEKLAIKNPDFYSNAEVTLKLGRRVETIKRNSKTVTLDNGESIAYDKLIIATGTRARKLTIEGADLPSVKYLRTIADVDDINTLIHENAKILIVGAGYIGLEIAASAIKSCASVTVLEAQDRVLARVTSPVVSAFYQKLHTDNGVDIRLQSGLSRIEKAGDSNIAVLADGERLEFDCAVIGIGVIPNSELAEQAGLECDNGIVVNEFTQTSDPDIYAVGDCSNHHNFIYDRRVRLESVPNAVAQAKTAAASICGKHEAYNQLPWFWSDQYNIKLQTAGLFQDYDDLIVSGDVELGKFTVTYLKQSKVIAMDALNSPADFMRAKKSIIAELAS